MITTRPNYADISKYVAEVYDQIQQSGKSYDLIVGLASGGCIPATILAYMLGNIQHIDIPYSSKIGKGAHRKINMLVDISDSFKNVLVVDDLVDSGNSIQEVVDHYIGLGYNTDSAVLYHKEGSIHTPTYAAIQIPKDFGFIYFPWE